MLLPVLDQRLHRLAGGPLLRVLGHHALPLPQRRRALGPALQPRTRPRLPDRARTWPKASQHLQMLGVKYFMAETPDIEAAGRRRQQPAAGRHGRALSRSPTRPARHVIGAAAHLEDLRGRRLGRGRPARLPARRHDGRARKVGQRRGSRPPSRGTSTPAGGTSSKRRPAPRAGPGSRRAPPPCRRTPLPPVQVSNIHEGTESISFNVDQTGVPVLVKTSYFPELAGRAGPRASTGSPPTSWSWSPPRTMSP